MKVLVVGVGDCVVSDDREAVLVTHGLGSCIAVAVHDPAVKVGGLLHFMLPESRLDPEKARENPYAFADTGIPLLVERACALGADKRRLVVRAAGGAQIMDLDGLFEIGKRNYQAMRRVLWKAGLILRGEDVGGLCTRTVGLEVGSGRMWCRVPGERERDLANAPAFPWTGVFEWHTVS